MKSHNWIDFGIFFPFFCKFLQGTLKKRMADCKIIFTPLTKEPKICHDLATTSAFNLKLCPKLNPTITDFITFGKHFPVSN